MEDLTVWMNLLADKDAGVRAKAARRLFAKGAELVRPVLDHWRAHPDLAALLAAREAGAGKRQQPQLTVGIAVWPATFERIRAANGSPPLADVPPDQDAEELELRLENGVSLDILTTKEPGRKGAIARFLEKLGEGIQQIECHTKNVERATELIRARFGLEPIYPATRAGADRTRVNFFLVPLASGRKVLVELVEKE